MGKLTDLEVLAALENLRIYKQRSNDSIDNIIRVCSAIVARNAGFESRTDWTEAISSIGLVDYGIMSRTEEEETARENYKKIMRRA